MKRSYMFGITAALMVSLLAGCGSSAEVPVVENANTTKTAAESEKNDTTKATVVTPEVLETQAPEQTVVYNKYTGQPTEKDLSSKRGFVFMCNNISVATPHAGVSKSDLIMELMEEGGITRMMVFFQDPSAVEKIGPIRSARAYNIDTSIGYDAFLVHCGCSSEGDQMIADLGLQTVDQISGGYGEAFYRDQQRIDTVGSEHSLYAIGSEVVKAAENKGYRLEHEGSFDVSFGLSFDENAVSQCSADAANIHVVYAGGKTSDFVYDSAKETYAMYQYGEEYTDDGAEKVPFDNVVNIFAKTYLQSDGQHLTIELGEGTGTFFTKGKAVEIKWYKNGREDTYHYTLMDGTPLKFTPGRTFVAVNQTGENYQGSVSYE